jgi:phosphoribosylanthranilate isomerase
VVAVKCCGIRRLEDVDLCLEAGADYVGVIRVEGTPRFQPLSFLEQVVKDTRAFPHSQVVAVYQNPPLSQIQNDIQASGVSIVQLHGTESLQDVMVFNQALKNKATLWKVFNLLELPPLACIKAYAPYVESFLLDAPKSFKQEIPWESLALAPILKTCQDLGVPVFLAGKLRTEKIPLVLSRFQVTGLDVASGLEDPETGFKDAEKVRVFIREAKIGDVAVPPTDTSAD